jgi:hypothetical protein
MADELQINITVSVLRPHNFNGGYNVEYLTSRKRNLKYILWCVWSRIEQQFQRNDITCSFYIASITKNEGKCKGSLFGMFIP